MMNLMTNLLGLGGHLGGWRHKDAWPDNVMNLDHAIHTAQTAERGLFDLLFLADGNAVRQMDKPALFAANSPSDRPAVFEPVTLFAAVAQHTKRIGLVATTTTTYEEPFTIARKFASLDHLSRGRAGWNLVTPHYVEDAKKAKEASAGASCANCALYQGASGSSQGPCQLFPENDVVSAGWCSSWAAQM